MRETAIRSPSTAHKYTVPPGGSITSADPSRRRRARNSGSSSQLTSAPSRTCASASSSARRTHSTRSTMPTGPGPSSPSPPARRPPGSAAGARTRRVLVVEPERLDPARPVAARSSVSSHVHDAIASAGRVDRPRAFVRDPAKRCAELGESSELPVPWDGTERYSRAGAGPRAPRGPPLEPVLGRRDRVGDNGIQAKASEALSERRPARDGAGHRHGPGAELLDRGVRISAQGAGPAASSHEAGRRPRPGRRGLRRSQSTSVR